MTGEWQYSICGMILRVTGEDRSIRSQTWPGATSCLVIGWIVLSRLLIERFISWFYVVWLMCWLLVHCLNISWLLIDWLVIILFVSCLLNDYSLIALWYVEFFLTCFGINDLFPSVSSLQHIYYLFHILFLGIGCSIAGCMLIALFLFRCLLFRCLWIYYFFVRFLTGFNIYIYIYIYSLLIIQ